MTQPLPAQTLLTMAHGDSQSDKCGRSVARLGDLNGDGLDDFIMGCPNDGPYSGANYGRALVCSGRDGSTIFDLHGMAVDDWFGYSVANAGDTNRDGFVDFVVGAPPKDAAAPQSGVAFLYSGKDGTGRFAWSGDSTDDNLGWAVGGGGDVDADGFSDVLVGAWRDDKAGFDTGSVYVFSGFDGHLIHHLTGTSISGWFGGSVANAGDVDGDGHADVLVGAFNDSTSAPSAGMAIVFSGQSGAVLHSFYGTWAGGQFGYSVAGAGDVDGDGVPDVMVGAPDESVTGYQSGSAYVYSGADGSLVHVFHGLADDYFLGESVSGAGDVNADGYSDLVIGVPNEPFPRLFGAAHAYSGRDGSLLFKAFGEYIGSTFGIAVSGGGDMNGDGFDDIVVGSPQSQFAAFFDGTAYVYSPCPLPPLEYCTAKTSSQGCVPLINWAGTTSLSDSDASEVRGWNLIPGQDAFLLLGARPLATAWQGGTLCVGAPALRLHAGETLGTPDRLCSGKLKVPLSQERLADLGLTAGSTFYVQLVARDPGFPPPDSSVSTPGLRITLCP